MKRGNGFKIKERNIAAVDYKNCGPVAGTGQRSKLAALGDRVMGLDMNLSVREDGKNVPDCLSRAAVC
jgi:hypothetical protein